MNKPAAPATINATPPPIIHIEWSLGLPVNTRVTSEPKECDALTPNTVSAMPPARTPNAMARIKVMQRTRDCPASSVESSGP